MIQKDFLNLLSNTSRGNFNSLEHRVTPYVTKKSVFMISEYISTLKGLDIPICQKRVHRDHLDGGSCGLYIQNVRSM